MSATMATTTGVTIAGVTINGASSVTNGGVEFIDTNLTVANDVQYSLAFAAAKVKGYIIYCPTACTIKVNSTGSPAPSIAVGAGVPIVWDTNSPYAKLFTVDVTTVYISSAAASRLQFYVILDPTT